MAVISDWSIIQREDANLIINLAAPTPIGGWQIEFKVQKRFEGISGLILASVASGFNGLSGINITNSGNGTLNVTIPGPATSGWDCANYAYGVQRVDSGFRTVLSQGFLTILPGTG